MVVDVGSPVLDRTLQALFSFDILSERKSGQPEGGGGLEGKTAIRGRFAMIC